MARKVASFERWGSFMKKCPFCAESIQDEAIKCRFCGENVSVDVMLKVITADHITQQSNVINDLLATKSKQDQDKAKLVLQELICQIKDAPNKSAFAKELENAVDAYQKLEGSPVEVLSKDKSSPIGCMFTGILFVSVVVSVLLHLGKGSYATQCKRNLTELARACELFDDRMDRYPRSIEELGYYGYVEKSWISCPTSPNPIYEYAVSGENYSFICKGVHSEEGLPRGFPRYHSEVGLSSGDK